MNNFLKPKNNFSEKLFSIALINPNNAIKIKK